jgi:hypothetical protein
VTALPVIFAAVTALPAVAAVAAVAVPPVVAAIAAPPTTVTAPSAALPAVPAVPAAIAAPPTTVTAPTELPAVPAAVAAPSAALPAVPAAVAAPSAAVAGAPSAVVEAVPVEEDLSIPELTRQEMKRLGWGGKEKIGPVEARVVVPKQVADDTPPVLQINSLLAKRLFLFFKATNNLVGISATDRSFATNFSEALNDYLVQIQVISV